MCGIVGALGKTNTVAVLLEGLRRLEYRGYDSCGVAVVRDGTVVRSRTTARVADLQAQASSFESGLGIAHTRWATHGKPDTRNAHPHVSHDLIAVAQRHHRKF
jgi:glucosamine--fructose-6-phosphate aminotransferase (isomerizing)